MAHFMPDDSFERQTPASAAAVVQDKDQEAQAAQVLQAHASRQRPGINHGLGLGTAVDMHHGWKMPGAEMLWRPEHSPIQGCAVPVLKADQLRRIKLKPVQPGVAFGVKRRY
jgi:hypothetical protein